MKFIFNKQASVDLTLKKWITIIIGAVIALIAFLIIKNMIFKYLS